MNIDFRRSLRFRSSAADGFWKVSQPSAYAWHHHRPAVRVLALVHDRFLTEEIDVKYFT